jgi:regulation of enolase protein 1 (concanavalin A-like superfamily)
MLTLTGFDLGSPRLGGSTHQAVSAVEITAGGADIWGTRDECHFACAPVTGSFELSVRLEALTMADVYTKAGIMLRASLEAGAPHVMLLAFGDNQPRNHNNGGLEFQSRLAPNGACSGIYPPQPLPAQPDFPVHFPHVWLKLTRERDVFTGYFSTDGKVWRQYCVHQQALPRSAQVGLAVTSHHVDHKVVARFTELRFHLES